jgi:hypothetical protein
MTGGAPFSKAGVKSTSRGMIPLLSRLIMPLLISSSEIGGGSPGPRCYVSNALDANFFDLNIPPKDFLAVYALLLPDLKLGFRMPAPLAWNYDPPCDMPYCYVNSGGL